jgi:hypothetical protein
MLWLFSESGILMRTGTLRSKCLPGVALGTLLIVLATPSEARPIRVDFSSDPTQSLEDNFNESQGGSWLAETYLDLTSIQNSSEINIGFYIDFGSGPVNTLFINENGFVTFGASADFAAGGLPAGTNYIAPLYAELQSTAPSNPPPAQPFQTTGEISYAQGVVDQTADPDPTAAVPYSFADAQPAFRVSWWQVVNDAGTTMSAQVVLVHVADATDPNAFDIEFNYGFENLATTAPLSGFHLTAANAVSYQGPFTALGGDTTFSFRNGVFVAPTTPPPTSVPEPSPLSLLLAGTAAIVLRRTLLARRTSAETSAAD